MFGWRACVGALALKEGLLKRLHGLNVRCVLCEALQESNIHDLLACLQAQAIWAISGIEAACWDTEYRTIYDAFLAMKENNESKLEDFIAVMWTGWNMRNQSMFGNKVFNPHILLKTTNDFVAGCLVKFRQTLTLLHLSSRANKCLLRESGRLTFIGVSWGIGAVSYTHLTLPTKRIV